jgi:hypothetical protein
VECRGEGERCSRFSVLSSEHEARREGLDDQLKSWSTRRLSTSHQPSEKPREGRAYLTELPSTPPRPLPLWPRLLPCPFTRAVLDPDHEHPRRWSHFRLYLIELSDLRAEELGRKASEGSKGSFQRRVHGRVREVDRVVAGVVPPEREAGRRWTVECLEGEGNGRAMSFAGHERD